VSNQIVWDEAQALKLGKARRFSFEEFRWVPISRDVSCACQGDGMKWNVSVKPIDVTLAQPGRLRPAAQLA